MTQFVTDAALENWHAHHPPESQAIIDAHQQVRTEFLALSVSMNGLLPEGPDKTVALRAIRDAAMQCNAVIACAQRLYGDGAP